VLESAFDELGLGLEDVQRIVLTHYHGDHLGQAERIRRAASLEVWTHEDEAPMCELFSAERDERIEDTEALFREYGVPEELRDRQRAQRGGGGSGSALRRHGHRPALRGGESVPFKSFSL
jgi:hydroxyacylglutathione hydrolase